MMLSVKGRLKDGIVYPDEPIESYGERSVTILIDEGATDAAEAAKLETGWEALTKLIAECQVDTGIHDLAHQHDHYLRGTPRREE